MKKMMIVFLLAISWFAQPAFSHGEDKPGPNQGYIRMPGGFHTEVVPNGDTSLKVFLLDIGFKNPVTKDSTLKVSLKDGDLAVNLSCEPSEEFFKCTLPKGSNLKSGTLELQATRLGAAGILVRYPLPLRYTGMPH